MPSNEEPGPPADRIVIPAELSAMECLPGWVEAIAKSRSLDDPTHFAIHICLEEAISNVIRHGYVRPAQGSTVVVDYAVSPDGELIFTVEDSAPQFNPLTAPEMPLLDADGEFPPGGRGIRLLRGFATSLEYEPTPTGNRLRIGFALP